MAPPIRSHKALKQHKSLLYIGVQKTASIKGSLKESLLIDVPR
jgi:hypothetical protein